MGSKEREEDEDEEDEESIVNDYNNKTAPEATAGSVLVVTAAGAAVLSWCEWWCASGLVGFCTPVQFPNKF